jgi:antitoxin VapB
MGRWRHDARRMKQCRPVGRNSLTYRADERAHGHTRPNRLLQPDTARHMSLAYARGKAAMAEQRHVRLFRNGRNQAVRIPVEFELPGDEAIIHRDGDRLVIEPVRKRGLIALLKTMKPLKEQFPEIDDPVPTRENVF